MPAIPTGKPWYYYLSHLLILIGLAILGGILFSVIAMLIAVAIYDIPDVPSLLEQPEDQWQHPGLLLLLQGLGSIGTFVAPAVFYPAFLRKGFFEFHPLQKPVPITLLMLAVVVSFLALNPVALTAELNALVDLQKWGSFGQWLLEQEQSTKAMAQELIMQESTSGFVMAMLVIAVIPAIGEELLFRGVLQRIFQAWSGRHVGIIIAAVLFSIIHVEFSGLLPRIFLGLLLGYVFYWTNNLWFPIIIHFLNNAIIVVAAQFVPVEFDVNEIGTPELWAASLGTLLFAGFLYFFYKIAKARRPHGEELGEDLYYEPTTRS